jgi:subtilisin family serine protease
MNTLLRVLLLSITLSLAAAVAPLLHADSPSRVPDQYIVVFLQNSTVEIRDNHVAALGARVESQQVASKVLSVFDIEDLIGYTAILDSQTLAQELAHPNILYIEADQVVKITDSTATQTGATWGINRISQTSLPLTGRYSYWASAGLGVDAYVVDTGILLAHKEFEGRAKFGANYAGGANDDCNGHGTHVAGTIGGATYGVAKKVTLIAVKVLDCAGSGTNAGVINGIDYVTRTHKASATKRSVANMSLGGGASTTLDSAVASAVSAGVTFAIAAGNDNANACNYSPARAATAITVGATANTDARATYSNFGTCLNIFAPGTSITSSWIGASNTATNTISGTSMATPHVAGAVAAYLGHLANISPNGAVPTPAAVGSWLTGKASASKVTTPGTGSPNLLLFSPFSD